MRDKHRIRIAMGSLIPLMRHPQSCILLNDNWMEKIMWIGLKQVTVVNEAGSCIGRVTRFYRSLDRGLDICFLCETKKDFVEVLRVDAFYTYDDYQVRGLVIVQVPDAVLYMLRIKKNQRLSRILDGMKP